MIKFRALLLLPPFIFFLLAATYLEAKGQVTFKSSNLPIVVINTHGQAILDEPKITADMGIINNTLGVINHLTDSYNDYSGKIGIELRGSTSQMFPKKQYGIELRDIAGNGIDASVLGMPAKDDWVLFAPYNDKSLMRDALAYTLGRRQGRYASRVKFCEVVLNGEYQGVYVMLEKIKRDKFRVDIAKLTNTDNSGDQLTGGYILKIDKATGSGGSGFTSAYPPSNADGGQTISFMYDYPKDVAITGEQKAYIKQFMDKFEDVLYGPMFGDVVNGFRKYADEDSFIDYFIMNEVTKNADAYRLSTFMSKEKDSKGGKLSMGPIWDFNLGFGNVNYCTQGTPEGFVLDFNSICPGDYWQIPFWWDKMFQDVMFHNKVVSRWTALRSGPFQTENILQYVDSVSNVLSSDSAQQRNFAQWPVLGQYVWPNYYVGNTYQEEVDWLKNWIIQRMTWLDANLLAIPTAIPDRPSTLEVLVYPNPFTSASTIRYRIEQPAVITFDVFNAMGLRVDQVVNRHELAGTYEYQYNSSLPPGAYILRSQANQEVRFLRVVKGQ